MAATLQVLVRDGYQKLTTTRVAERAGVSVGTLYQYFPDKRSLVTALKVHYFELLFREVGAVAATKIGAPIELVARAMIETLLATKRKNLALTLALREPMAELGGEALVREATGQLVAVTRAVIEASMPGIRESEQAARVVISSVEGVIAAVIQERPQELSSRALADELVALVVGYVKQRGGAARHPRSQRRGD